MDEKYDVTVTITTQIYAFRVERMLELEKKNQKCWTVGKSPAVLFSMMVFLLLRMSLFSKACSKYITGGRVL